MRKRLFLIILSLSCQTSADIPLPKEVKSFDDVLDICFQGAKEYFQSLRDARDVMIEGDRFLVMDTDRNASVRLTVRLEQKEEPGSLVEILYFTRNKSPSARMEFYRKGPNLEKMKLSDVLDGKFPKCGNCTEYRVVWPQMGFEARKWQEGEFSEGVFSVYDNLLTLKIQEVKKPSETRTKTLLFYRIVQQGPAIETISILQGMRAEHKYCVASSACDLTPKAFHEVYKELVSDFLKENVSDQFQYEILSMDWPTAN